MSRIGSIDIITNSQSAANNTSSITVKGILTTTGDSWRGDFRTGTYTIKQGNTVLKSGSFTHGAPKNSTTTLFSVTLTVTHNTDGTSGTISATYSYDSGWATATQSKTLTTIVRKSTLAIGSGTLGAVQSLTVTRKASSFTHTITYKCGSASGTICTKSTDTTPDWTPPLSLASQNTSGTSLSVTYTITTYNGSTSLGSNSYTKTVSIPSSVKPSVTFTVAEASDLQWGVYVQDISKLKIVLDVTTAYGSAIASYKTTVDGKTYTASTFTTDVLTSSGDLTITTTVTDKRGRSASYSNAINVLEYLLPSFPTFKLQRCNEDGTENMQGEFGKVTFECTCSPLNGNNEVVFDIEYKKTEETEYTLHKTLAYGNIEGTTETLTEIFPAESGSSYNVRITAKDAFKTAIQLSVLSTGFSIIHWLANGLGLAFGKIAELSNVLDIGFQTRFFGGILQPVLEAETDLDTLMTPNTYTLKNVNSAGYSNCPFETGTGTLTIEACGEEGQVHQIVTVCEKTNPLKYERLYYQGTWGEWLCTSDFDGTLLWDGSVSSSSNGYYMSSTQTATLYDKISKQRNGIVLVFSYYEDGSGQDQNFHEFFVPKYVINRHPGKPHNFFMFGEGVFARKYLYIYDDKITGYVANNTGQTINGIAFTNQSFVLRYVIGV